MSLCYADQTSSQKILLMLDFLSNDRNYIVFQNKFSEYQTIVSGVD